MERHKTIMPSTVNHFFGMDQNVDHIFAGVITSITLIFVFVLAMQFKTFFNIWIGEKVCMVTIENG